MQKENSNFDLKERYNNITQYEGSNKSTRRLFIKGNQTQELINKICEGTKLKIMIQSVDELAAIVKFKGNMKLSRVIKMMEDLPCVQVFISDNPANDDTFLSSSSSGGSFLSLQLPSLANLSTEQPTIQQQKDSFYQTCSDQQIYEKFAMLIITNGWELDGLIQYICIQNLDQQPRLFGILSTRMNELQNSVNLGQIKKKKGFSTLYNSLQEDFSVDTQDIDFDGSYREKQPILVLDENEFDKKQFNSQNNSTQNISLEGNIQTCQSPIILPQPIRQKQSIQDHYVRMDSARGGHKSVTQSSSKSPNHHQKIQNNQHNQSVSPNQRKLVFNC